MTIHYRLTKPMVWIPWCWSCGVEDASLQGSGPSTVASELIPRLSCKGCGEKVVALPL